MIELLQIHGSGFTAGLCLKNGICVRAAPILRNKFLGRTALEVQNSIVADHWTAVSVKSLHARQELNGNAHG
jgi:hypothetical protein